MVKLGHNPIILVSRLDERNGGELRKSFTLNAEEEKVLTDVGIAFGACRGCVRYCINYIDEKERVYEIDQLACQNLAAALNAAAEYDHRVDVAGESEVDKDSGLKF